MSLKLLHIHFCINRHDIVNNSDSMIVFIRTNWYVLKLIMYVHAFCGPNGLITRSTSSNEHILLDSQYSIYPLVLVVGHTTRVLCVVCIYSYLFLL